MRMHKIVKRICELENQAHAIREDARMADGDWRRYIRQAEALEREAARLRQELIEPERKRLLAKIHIGRKQLGMDEDTYRRFLRLKTGETTAKDLTLGELERVVHALQALGARYKAKRRPRPAKTKAAMARKIVAMMKDLGYTDRYVDAMAQRMFGVERWEWLDEEQTEKLLAALAIHQRRKEHC